MIYYVDVIFQIVFSAHVLRARTNNTVIITMMSSLCYYDETTRGGGGFSHRRGGVSFPSLSVRPPSSLRTTQTDEKRTTFSERRTTE